jgi:hypothetical protein
MKTLRITLVTVLWVMVIVEFFSYLCFTFGSMKIDYKTFMSTFKRDGYENFMRSAYNAKTGWQNVSSRTRKVETCDGVQVVYSYDSGGQRKNSDSGNFEILTFGDSYTFGAEANDNETYPSFLGRILDAKVVNYGVNGFGPLQALLYFEQKIDSHQTADIVILGIMYENIRRLVNSFPPIYSPGTGNRFGFKPYISFGDTTDTLIITANPNDPARKFENELKNMITDAYNNDYWASTERKFPYTLGVVKLVCSNRFRARFHALLAKYLNQQLYVSSYKDAMLRKGLEHIIERFIDVSKSKKIFPVVLFIPQNQMDIESPRVVVKDLRQKYKDSAAILDVGEEDIKWDKFNRLQNECHPSPYGYRAIAEYVAAEISHSNVSSHK